MGEQQLILFPQEGGIPRVNLIAGRNKRRREALATSVVVQAQLATDKNVFVPKPCSFHEDVVHQLTGKKGTPALNFSAGDASAGVALAAHFRIHTTAQRNGTNYGALLRSQFEQRPTKTKRNYLQDTTGFRETSARATTLIADWTLNQTIQSQELLSEFRGFDKHVNAEMDPQNCIFFHPTAFILEMAFESVGSAGYELLHKAGFHAMNAFSAFLDVAGVLLGDPFFGINFAIAAGRYNPVFYSEDLSDEEVALLVQALARNLGFCLLPPVVFAWDPGYVYIFGEPWGGRHKISELPWLVQQTERFHDRFLSFMGKKEVVWQKLKNHEPISAALWRDAFLDVAVFVGELAIAVVLDPFMAALDGIVEGAIIVGKVELAAARASFPFFEKFVTTSVHVYADFIKLIERFMGNVASGIVKILRNTPGVAAKICEKADMLCVAMFGLKLSGHLKTFFQLFSKYLLEPGQRAFAKISESRGGQYTAAELAKLFGYSSSADLEVNVVNILKKTVDLAVQRLVALRKYVLRAEQLEDSSATDQRLKDLDEMMREFAEYSVEGVGGDVHGFAPSAIMAVYLLVMTTAISLYKKSPENYFMTPIAEVTGFDPFVLGGYDFIEDVPNIVSDEEVDDAELQLSGAMNLSRTPLEFEQIFRYMDDKVRLSQWKYFLDTNNQLEANFHEIQRSVGPNSPKELIAWYNYLYANMFLFKHMWETKEFKLFAVMRNQTEFVAMDDVDAWAAYVFDPNAVKALDALPKLQAPSIEAWESKLGVDD